MYSLLKAVQPLCTLTSEWCAMGAVWYTI